MLAIRPRTRGRAGDLDAKEARPGPGCSGDLSRDARQRGEAPALVEQTILQHAHGVGPAMPLPHQGRAGLQGTGRHLGSRRLARGRRGELTGGLPRATTVSGFLQAVSYEAAQQVGAQPAMRAGLDHPHPLDPEVLERHLLEGGDAAAQSRRIIGLQQSFDALRLHR